MKQPLGVKSRKKLLIYYSLGFALPLLLGILIFTYLRLSPFGNRNLLISDMGTQYIPFMTQLRRMILEHQFSFYSFSLGVGDNFFPIVAYYLISPFNLILLLGSASAIPTAVDWIILLKIATIATSLNFYLHQRYGNLTWSNYLFSLSYAFCGFVTSYFYDVMWLDALILLPLIVLGLRRLFIQDRWVLYTFALTATIITNFYLGYMSCLFALGYFIYLLMDQHKPHTGVRQTLHDNRRSIWRFLANSVISVLITTLVLLPTVLSMLQTSKQAIGIENYLPTLQFTTNVFTQFGVVGGTYAQRLYLLPSLFMGSFAIILLVLYFISRTIDRSHKQATIFLLIYLGVGLIFTPLNSVWHMMQQPEGFPFRNAFFFTFVALMCAYEVWQTRAKIPVKSYLVAFGIVAGLLIIGYTSAYLFRDHKGFIFLLGLTITRPALHYLWWSLGFEVLTISLLLLEKQFSFSTRVILMLVLSLEIAVNFIGSIGHAGFGNQTKYEKNYFTESKFIKKAQASSTGFFRISNENSLINRAFKETYNNYNDPLLFGFNGLNTYSSTMNNNMRRMMWQLGFFSKNSRRLSGAGATELTYTLFATKYQLDMKPTDYDLITHNNALGLGFMVNPKVKQVNLKDYQALQNQEKLLQGIMGNAQRYFYQATASNIKVTRSGKHYNYQMTLSPQATGKLYAYFTTTNVYDTKLKILNGTTPKQSVNVTSTAVQDLGDYKQGQPINVSFRSYKKLTDPASHFTTLNHRIFNQSIQKLKQGEFHVSSQTNSSDISGTVDVKNNQILFLSIPYNSGWKIKDNGKSIHPVKIAGDLTGIPLNKGKHQLTLRYDVPGLRVGLMIATFALVLLPLEAYIYKKK